MTKESLGDQELTEYLNRNFVNTSLDSRETTIQELNPEYNLLGVPSCYFINAEGKIILAETGYRSADELIELASSVKSFYSNKALRDLLANFDENRYEKEYLEELIELSEGTFFPDQHRLFDYYYNALLPADREANYELFKTNLKHASPKVAALIIEQYQRPTGFLISNEERQAHSDFVNAMEKKIQLFYTEAHNKNDLSLLDLTGEISKKLARKRDRFNSLFVKKAVEEYDHHLLRFFLENDLRRDYALQAIDVIDKYVLIKSPTQMRDADIEREEFPEKSELDYCPDEPIIIQETNRGQDSLLNLQRKFAMTFQAAEKMDKICQKFLEFFEDEGARNKAAYWSSMSYRYFNMAEFYLTHARILLAQEKEEDALAKAKEGLELGSPNPEVENALRLFIYTIEGEPEETTEN